MYLSQLILNPRSREVRRDLRDSYELHRTLARAFALDEQTPPSRFLWRLESGTDWQDPILLVQSEYAGNWQPIMAMSNYLRSDIREKTFDPGIFLRKGQTLRFRLQANPTVCRERKRWALFKEDDQLEWLSRQGERYGFSPIQTIVSASRMLRCRKGESLLSVFSVTFEGYLEVVDVNLLTEALRCGIGPAKSLGLGLLSLGKSR